MSYCPKCGTEVGEDDDYCIKCRQPLKEEVRYKKVTRRRDFSWGDHDEDQYGPLIGGGIIIWLGVLLMLQNQWLLRGADFGGFFMMGIGVILIFRGFIAYQKSGSYDEGFGFLAGGGIVLLIGAGLAYNIRDWWAYLIIAVGLLIVSRAFTNR